MSILSFKSWSLRTRMLCLLVAASTTPIAVAVFVELRESQSIIEADAKRLLDARADQLADHCDMFHRGHLAMGAQLAALPRVVRYCEAGAAEREQERANVTAALVAFEAGSPAIRAVAIADVEGTVTATSDGPRLGANYKFRSYIRKALLGTPVVSDVFVALPETVPSIAYATPVRNGAGTVTGLVVIYVRATAFWGAVQDANGRAGEGSFSVVYDRFGVRIAHSFNVGEIFHPAGPLDPATLEDLVAERRFGVDTRKMLESPSPMPEEFRFVAEQPRDEMFRGYSPANGEWNRFVCRKLATATWTLFVLVPEKALGAPLQRLIRDTLGASAVLALLAFAGGLLLSNGIVGAVRSLSAAARRMKAGDLRARAELDLGGELGELATTLNGMADSLLTERESLSEKVRDRTEALAEAVVALEARNEKLAEQTAELERRQAREIVYSQAAVALAGEGSLDEVVRAGLRAIAPTVGAAVMACHRLRDGSLSFVAGYASGPGTDSSAAPLAGLAEEAFVARRPIVIEPLPDDSVLRFDATLASGRPRSIAIVPLFAGERRVGVLAVGGLVPFAPEALVLLADVASPLAVAIVRHELLEESRRVGADLATRNEELRAQSEELKVQGEHLRVQQQELDGFFSMSLDLLCVADFDGHFKRLNPAWQATLGFTQAELVAEPFLSFVHPADRDATTAVFARVLEGHTIRSFENRYRCKDGSYRWLAWSSAPVMAERLVYAVATDVTERHRAEEQLRAQSEELRLQSEALAAKNAEIQRASQLKTDFLANMSHELRTPLNAVIGFSELLLEDAGALGTMRARYVEDILASGRHLLALINDILDLVKIEAGRTRLNVEPVDADEAIANAVVLVEPPARKKHMTIARAVRAKGPALADPARLKQILLNLLSNAVKFAPEGSSIEVGAEDAGPFVRFWIRDEGPGMNADLLARLFQPFVQGESSLVKVHPGTGLGLAISKGLVEQHGGHMEVASAVGSGSTFSFTLLAAQEFDGAPRAEESPADERALASPAVSLEPDPAAADARPLVLVVGENPGSASLLRSWLTDAGYSCAQSGSSAEALELATRLEPRLILLDLDIEQGGGFQVLQELKARPSTRKIPVVIASVDQDARRGLALGAADYLVKPLDRASLLERIAAIVAPDGRQPLVLAIDDDPSVSALLAPALERAGYRFVAAATGTAGLELAYSRRPDLVIVDLVLPDLSGFEVIDSLARDERTREIPVLVLTARELDDAERDALRRHARALAEKGDLTKEALLAAVAAATRRAPGEPAARRGATILVVDDHDMNRELVRTILERMGFAVAVAADGEAGVEAARRTRPDLVLMDLAMPRKDGFTATRELKADPATRDIPIVALTAFAMRSDERRVQEAGFDGYLTKPVHQTTLKRTLAAHLGPR